MAVFRPKPGSLENNFLEALVAIEKKKKKKQNPAKLWRVGMTLASRTKVRRIESSGRHLKNFFLWLRLIVEENFQMPVDGLDHPY